VSVEQAQASLQPYYRSVLEEEVRQMTGSVTEAIPAALHLQAAGAERTALAARSFLAERSEKLR